MKGKAATEIGKTIGIHTDIEIDDTLNKHNQNTPDLNDVQLINKLTNSQIPENIKELFATQLVALEHTWIFGNKTDSINNVVGRLHDDTKALATVQCDAVQQLLLFRIFWILILLNILSLSILFYGTHKRFS